MYIIHTHTHARTHARTHSHTHARTHTPTHPHSHCSDVWTDLSVQKCYWLQTCCILTVLWWMNEQVSDAPYWSVAIYFFVSWTQWAFYKKWTVDVSSKSLDRRTAQDIPLRRILVLFQRQGRGTCWESGWIGVHMGFSERLDTILNWTKLGPTSQCGHTSSTSSVVEPLVT